MILLLSAIYQAVLRPLLRFDHWLFHKINQIWINPFFDLVMPFVRQQEFWYFFYLFLLVFALYNFGIKGCWWAVSLIMTAIVSDLVQQFIDQTPDFSIQALQRPGSMPTR